MIVDLFVEPATLVHRVAGAPDTEGNPTTTSTSEQVLGRFDQQRTDDETSADRRTTRARWYMAPDVAVDGNDQLVIGARTFEIEGAPYLASTPRGPHHWEVTLREVTP